MKFKKTFPVVVHLIYKFKFSQFFFYQDLALKTSFGSKISNGQNKN